MKKISVVSLLTMLVSTVFAEEANVVEQYAQQKVQYNSDTSFPRGVQFGIGVSPTSGLNAFVGYNNKSLNSFWWKRFGFRLDFATYSPIKNKLNTEINDAIGNEGYKVSENVRLKDFEIYAKHIGAIIDFYPFGDTWLLGGWRVSGGYMTGKLDLNAGFVGYEKAGVTGFCVNDYFYYYSNGQLYGRAFASWKYSGPYLGTGFDLGLIAGLKLYMDAGVVFTSTRPDIDVNIPLDGLMRFGEDTGYEAKSVKDNSEVLEFFEQNKEAALAEARNEVKDYKYYPIVKLGLMYRF